MRHPQNLGRYAVFGEEDCSSDRTVAMVSASSAGLSFPIADDPGEPECSAATVPSRLLHAVERDVRDLLGSDEHDVALAVRFQF